MPGVSLKLRGLDAGEPLAGAETLLALPWFKTPTSARVGESDAEDPELIGVVADPISMAVGRSSPVRNSDGRFSRGIFSPEDDRPLSSGRGGFSGTIEYCGSGCQNLARAVRRLESYWGKRLCPTYEQVYNDRLHSCDVRSLHDHYCRAKNPPERRGFFVHLEVVDAITLGSEI